MKAEHSMEDALTDEIQMHVDEIEIQPNVPLSMKPSEKPKMIMRSILVSSVCAAFILGWAGYPFRSCFRIS